MEIINRDKARFLAPWEGFSGSIGSREGKEGSAAVRDHAPAAGSGLGLGGTSPES